MNEQERLEKRQAEILEERQALVTESENNQKRLRELDEVTYSIGDRFKKHNRKWIAVRFDKDKVGLICLDDGNRWSDPIDVRDDRNITREDTIFFGTIKANDFIRYWDFRKKELIKSKSS